ncbi:MAG: PAS domain-containing sensor histidine kinase [Promethearchaeota archaeon]|nr:MAG: PAS domain-containing sensor histidine kinase [Candidatus Lokiarchaeota archaeon]
MTEKDNNLELNEERCKIVLKSISIPIYTWQKSDEDLILIDYNIAAEKVTKGRIEEYIGIKATELYKDQPEILKELYNCVNKQVDIYREMEYKFVSTGEKKYLSVKYNFVSPDLVIIHTEDITQRKKAQQELKRSEEELRESQERYRNIFDTVPTSLILVDKEGIIIDINPYHLKHLAMGKTRKEEFIGKNIFTHPTIMNAGLSEKYKKVLEGEPLNLKDQYFPSLTTGSDGYFNIRAVPLFKNEDVIGAIFTHEDITDRKNIEEILKKEKQEKSIILENILEHIVFQSLDHTVIYPNKAACDSVNQKAEQLIGRKCHEIWQGSNEVCENCPVERSFKTKKPEVNEITTIDGRVWFIKGYPIIDEKGNLIGGVEVTSEITEKKHIEDKLKKSEKMYREAYNSSNLYKDLFTHDINNIFQNILSSIELYNLYRKDPEKQFELEEIENLIVQQILRGTMLVSNVQNLSAIENYEPSLFSIEVNEVLKKAINFVRKSFPNKKINIKTESIQNEYFVIANELLQNAFENLLFNAVKHNNNEIIKIDINLSKDVKDDKKIIKIEFIDNGVGISDSMKGEIFQREYKEYLNYKLPSGIGLGLLFTKKVIESFNGEIKVEDRIEGDYTQGSNFIILLPEEK